MSKYNHELLSDIEYYLKEWEREAKENLIKKGYSDDWTSEEAIKFQASLFSQKNKSDRKTREYSLAWNMYESLCHIHNVRESIIEERYLDAVLSALKIPLNLLGLDAESGAKSRIYKPEYAKPGPSGMPPEILQWDDELRSTIRKGIARATEIRDRLKRERNLDVEAQSVERALRKMRGQLG